MPKPTTIEVLVTLAKANARPATKRDVARIEEALLNESAELIHGCEYSLNSTLWQKPILSGEFIEVLFEIEVEPYDNDPKTADELAFAVENDIGFLAPDWCEVESVNTRAL